mmetsp:Transcript_8506/g.15421  ORF Transcript_8506/g.15421 Transcript_8506/m.15421 type:complete len:289 (+) Transcript_8506:111-977(+)
MKGYVIFNERSNEVIGMIKSLSPIQCKGLSTFFGRRLEGLWLQLRVEKVIISSLINEDGIEFDQRCIACFQQAGCIMGRSICNGTQIGWKGLVSPGTIGGIANGRKRRHTGPTGRILEGNGESSMSSHTVTGNRGHGRIQLGKLLRQNSWQLLGHIGIHLVMRVIGSLRRIDIKSCSNAQIIRIHIGHTLAPRRRIWHHNRNPLLFGGRKGTAASLVGKISVITRQSTQPEQDRNIHFRRRGKVQAENHGGACARRLMLHTLVIPPVGSTDPRLAQNLHSTTHTNYIQ